MAKSVIENYGMVKVAYNASVASLILAIISIGLAVAVGVGYWSKSDKS